MNTNYINQKNFEDLEKTIKNDHANIAGIVVQKNGAKLYESYFNGYSPDNAIHVASVTKSITSVLIGIAIEKGYIKSIDQKVLDFFPNYNIISGEKKIQKITIKNMLTMTAPYKYKAEPYEKFFTSNSPIKDALDLLGGEEPIGKFLYSAIGGTHILSGILVKSTGKSVLDFAVEHLFSPLKINVPHNVVLRSQEEHIAIMNDKNTSGWAVDAQGVNTASWGLFLTPGDMAKIGQLYLNGGVWNGKQILSPEWIKESTKEHSKWEEIHLAYGYLWWIIDDKEQAYAAMGDGGNVIYVNTKKKTVISIAALFDQNAKDRIELIRNHIEPILEDYI